MWGTRSGTFVLALLLFAAFGTPAEARDRPGKTPAAKPPAPVERKDPSESRRYSLDPKDISRGSSGSPEAEDASFGATALRVGLTLVALVAVIVGMIWFLRRFSRVVGAAGAQDMMRVLARVPLAAKASLFLVKVGPKLLVVGLAGERMSALGEVDDPEEVARLVENAALRADEPSFREVVRAAAREDSDLPSPPPPPPPEGSQRLAEFKERLRKFQGET